ncbi:MAG: AI-2E family transporter [Ramlibacter sp.]
MQDAPLSREQTAVIAAFGLALLLVLWLQLLPALLAALGTYAIFESLQRVLGRRLTPGWSRFAAVVLTLLVLAALGLALAQAFELLWGKEGLAHLMRLLADTIDRLRVFMPSDVADSMPATADETQQAVSRWLRSHSRDLQHWGNRALRLTAYLLVGSAIGLLVAFYDHAPPRSCWIALGRRRLAILSQGFNNVVAAQVRIAAVNAILTGVFVLAALPLAGWPLPFARTLVVFTFAMGLVPIVGNLMSNAAIVLVGLSVSTGVGIACLVFLVAVHKLEYFLNAHFVGSRTRIAPYALLAAMLAGEAAFGAAGLVAAPIFCAWLARELQDAQLV